MEIGRLDPLSEMSVALRFSNGIKAKGPIKKAKSRKRNGLRPRFAARMGTPIMVINTPWFSSFLSWWFNAIALEA